MNKLETAHYLKTILMAKDFILTGTLALSEMGFKIPIKDLDIVLVKPEASTLEILQSLQTNYPPKNLIDYPQPLADKSMFRFVIEGVGVDVFIKNDIIVTNIQTKCGIKLAPINHIVEAKKFFGRPKDIVQLLSLSRNLITQEEFDKYIQNI
jgi:hypothetical protein